MRRSAAGHALLARPVDLPPIPTTSGSDEVGNAYVTDSFQATIWRVPPGGGPAEVWFQDIRLATTSFGPNGLRLSPDRTQMYSPSPVTSRDGPSSSPSRSCPTRLRPTWRCSTSTRAATSRRHRLRRDRVALRDHRHRGASGLSFLGPGGNEVARLGNQGNPFFPYDSPANVAFNGRGSALVANHAVFTGIVENFAVLDVFVNDRGSPLELPRIR